MNKAKFTQRVSLLLMMLFVAVSAMAAPISITGRVTDGTAPVPGAAVVVQGTSTGVVTDVDGSYTITVPSNSSVLSVTYLGYKNATATVGSRSVVDFKLEQDTIVAEELVVVGYGVQQKSHLTGAIARLDGNAIADMPVSDVATALQGQISGLNILNTTSEVGVAPEIRVRGTSSISADSSPLIVIDGFPVEDDDALSLIDPGDIQSIEVLKDASSAAIYGSRGAAGVILVTTKSGEIAKPSFSVKLYSGVKYAYQQHDLYSMKEYYDIMVAENAISGTSIGTANTTAAWLETQLGETDWQSLALRELTTTNRVQVSMSGGVKEAKYSFSAAYTNDEGLMLQNAVEKVNFRAKLDVAISKAVSAGVNISGVYSETTRPTNNFMNFYRTPSYLPVYHNDWSTDLTGYTGYAAGWDFYVTAFTADYDSYEQTGTNPTYSSSNSRPFSSTQKNPRGILDMTSKGEETFQSIGNMYVNVDIAKGLSFRTQNGYNVRFRPQYTYAAAEAYAEGEPSEATYDSTFSLTLSTENIFSYNWSKDEHKISAITGYTAQKYRTDYVSMEGVNLSSADITTLNAATTFSLLTSSGSVATGAWSDPDRVLQSYLARANYSFDDKYLVSGSIRLDSNSRFTDGYRNGWFPSLSLGWRVEQEPFMSEVNWINTLKLRASYGVTGNDRIDTYASTSILESANYVTGLGNGSLVAGLAETDSTRSNSSIGWEQTDEFNYGVDFGILKNRLIFTADYYLSFTRELLLERSIPSFTGYEEQWTNIGRIQNNGFEFTIDAVPITKKNFEWRISANIAHNDAKVLELNGEQSIMSEGLNSSYCIAIVGEAPIQYYGYKQIGVWNSDAEIAENPHFATGVDEPGGIRVADINGDGELSDADMTVIGDPYADFTWGITNSFKIKNFDVSVLIQGSQGGEVYNDDVNYTETMKWNKAYVANRWVSAESPGDGMTPYYTSGLNRAYTDYPLQDASYACLRNVTVGYTFDKKIAEKLKLKGLRIYATGSNLLYVWASDYKGINIESRYSDSNPLISGYQRGGYPITSTVAVGIDIRL